MTYTRNPGQERARRDVLTAGKRYCLLVGGSRCVSGDTVLDGHTITIRELADRAEPVLVHTSHGVQWAEAPFRKGADRLLRFELGDGRSVEVTTDHRFWNGAAWIKAEQLRQGDRVAVASRSSHSLQASSSEPSPSRSWQGVRHWTRTVQGLMGRYSVCRHQHDAQLRPDGFVARACRASLCDGLARILAYLQAGWPGSGSHRGHQLLPALTHSPVGLWSSRPAMTGGFPCSHHAAGFSGRAFEQISGWFRETRPVLRQSRLQSAPLLSAVGLDHGDQGLCGHSVPVSSDTPCKSGYKLSRINRITETAAQDYYTLHVPGCEHYFANGILHHNSGKTVELVGTVIERALLSPGSRHLIVRQEATSAKRAIVKGTWPEVVKLRWPGLAYEWKEQYGYFALPNGSEVWVGGLNDEKALEKILGNEYCVAPESLVLKADLSWVRADSLREGDELVGFPESLEGHVKLLPSKVLGAKIIQADRYRITTKSGSTIVSADHKMVAIHDDRRHRNFRLISWVAAKDLSVGDKVRFAAKPWREGKSRDDGWFAGMLDGEGWACKANRQVGVAQCSGDALGKLRHWLMENEIPYCEHVGKDPGTIKGACHQLRCAGLWASMRAVGICRPVRVSYRFWEGSRAFTAGGYDEEIISIEPLGVGPVVSMQTETQTFIADGFLAHNCTIYVNEGSEVRYSAWLLLRSRLAQTATTISGKPLSQRMYADLNPTTRNHWSYRLWIDGTDPESQLPVDPEQYAHVFVNPMDNAANLSQEYLDDLRSLPPRARKRFYDGQYVEDVEDALWRRAMIKRVANPPPLKRIVVAIDPAVTNAPGSDETGIIAVGADAYGNGYVLDDASGRFRPEEWARRAIAVYHTMQADRIVAEVNQGGDMVEATIRAINSRVPYRAVRASRGKVARAEPIAALYERGKIFHCGEFPELEDQMTAFTTGFNSKAAGFSPDRVDALIWGMADLFPELSRNRDDDTYEEPDNAVGYSEATGY
jgi:hypothetical protein